MCFMVMSCQKKVSYNCTCYDHYPHECENTVIETVAHSDAESQCELRELTWQKGGGFYANTMCRLDK